MLLFHWTSRCFRPSLSPDVCVLRVKMHLLSRQDANWNHVRSGGVLSADANLLLLVTSVTQQRKAETRRSVHFISLSRVSFLRSDPSLKLTAIESSAMESC